MKKFNAKFPTLKCAIAACLIALTGCIDSGPAHSETKVHGNTVVEHVTHEYDTKQDYNNTKFHIHKIEFEGHSYLYFVETGYHVGYAGFTHDENCKCLKNVRHD